MPIVNFSSVMQILRSHLVCACSSQVDLLYNIFDDYYCSPMGITSYIDRAMASRCLTGKRRLPRSIVKYYSTEKRYVQIAENLKHHYEEDITSIEILAQQLYDLVQKDRSIDDYSKYYLCSGYPCMNREQYLCFIARIVVYSLHRLPNTA